MLRWTNCYSSPMTRGLLWEEGRMDRRGPIGWIAEIRESVVLLLSLRREIKCKSGLRDIVSRRFAGSAHLLSERGSWGEGGYRRQD